MPMQSQIISYIKPVRCSVFVEWRKKDGQVKSMDNLDFLSLDYTFELKTKRKI